MHSTDPNHQNIKACMNSADFIFNNDGTLEQLVSSVEDTIEIIIQKDLA
jgi:dephospho-CoA kinase